MRAALPRCPAAHDGRPDRGGAGDRAGGARLTSRCGGLATPSSRRRGGPSAAFALASTSRYDSGMGRLGERDADAVLRLARAGRRRRAAGARRLLDPLRHRRRAGRRRSSTEQLDALRDARGAGARGLTPRCSSTPPTARPRSATRPPTSTWSAAGSPSTASTRSRGTPFERGLEPALELRSYVADVKRFERRRQRGLRADAGGRPWRPAWACSRSATATASGEGSPTTPTCWSAATAIRWSAPSPWTT